MMSDIGITPTNDGTLIRLVFPELTEERRKELVKDVKKRGEENRLRFVIQGVMAMMLSKSLPRRMRCLRIRSRN